MDRREDVFLPMAREDAGLDFSRIRIPFFQSFATDGCLRVDGSCASIEEEMNRGAICQAAAVMREILWRGRGEQYNRFDPLLYCPN